MIVEASFVEDQATGLPHGAQEKARAAVAGVEVVVVERGGELAGEVAEGGGRSVGEGELALEGPVELDAGVVGGALQSGAQERGGEDAQQAAAEDPAEGRRAGTAHPKQSAHRGDGESQAAENHVRVVEDTEVIGGVVGAHPEGDRDQSAECQLPHQPATRRQSKENRATAAATMATPRK